MKIQGIKNFLKTAGFTAETIEEGDFFDYFLWYKRAEYSIRFEKYQGDRLDISIRHYGENIRQDDHVYMTLGEFVAVAAPIEEEILNNRSIAFWKKPLAMWKRIVAAVSTEEKK